MIVTNNEMNVHALFIGDKAENGNLYKNMLNQLVDEHLGWHQNDMPQDEPFMIASVRNSSSFKHTVAKVKDVLEEISGRLRTTSVPWHSAGHF